MRIVNLMDFEGTWLLDQLFGPHRPYAIEIIDLHLKPEDEIIKTIEEADIIFADQTGKTRITPNIARNAGNIKLIQNLSAGYNGIDLEACKAAGIPVANAPGGNAFGVAEHTIMVVLMLLKRILFLNQRTHTGLWKDEEIATSIQGLQGKVYGLLGMGHIGRAVAKRLVAFGTRSIYSSRTRLSQKEEADLAVTWTGMDDVLKQADIISLHIALTDQTEGLIGAREIGLMKKNAIFVNVSRGPLVDEAALAEALKEKRIAGAGIDVFSKEPITSDNPLLGLDNVILSPHVGGSSSGARENIIAMVVENMARVQDGREPKYSL